MEKDINLSISLKFGQFLSIAGYDVIFTREVDEGTDGMTSGSISERKKQDMKNRLAVMSEFPEAIFVSIHLNKFTSTSAKGTQVFYAPKNEASYELGSIIQKSVVELLQPNNTRVVKKATKDIYLLYNAEIPAVIVECGFLSNSDELQLLKEEEYQSKIAFAIFCGILKYYS